MTLPSTAPHARYADWRRGSSTRRGAQTRLAQQFGSRDLAGFGVADLRLAIAAAGALLDYIQTTQRTALPHIQAIHAERDSDFVQLDAATRRNLELTETLRGEAAPTLLSVLDTTATGMGTRLLRHWLHHPLRDRDGADPATRCHRRAGRGIRRGRQRSTGC